LKTLFKLILATSLMAASSIGLAGWDQVKEQRAAEAIAEFKKADPDLKVFFDKGYGYAVFPTVGIGGLMYEASVGGQKFSYAPK
jgi:hypothetical protein